ncbi:MAG: hypothetical protein PHG23_02825 [Candidatus Pacebacteria bacterium]|nr:hypothetical protein [Candidatus Paceibacterota bacterium]
MEKIKNVKTSAKEHAIDELIKKQAKDDKVWENELEINQKSKPLKKQTENR